MQTGTEKPRFREDLLAEAIDEQGAKYIDVMDPDSGSVFRFHEIEFSIACAMDGARDVPGIVKWAQDELGVTPSANEIHTVIATLGDLGYLDQAAAASTSKAAASKAVAQPPAANVRARPARDTADLSSDTVVDVRPMGVPSTPRPPAPAEKMPTRPAVAPGQPSEVSIDLSEHLAVGKEDVQEAVRQSRVMAAVDAPLEIEVLDVTPPPIIVQPVKQPERPIEVRQPARPVERPEVRQPERPEVRQPERSVEIRQPERSEVRQPERSVEVRQPERSVEVWQPEPPVEHKQPVVLPNVPEKQPVPPAEPASRMKLVLIVILILALLGGGAFLVWKFVLDKPSQDATSSVSPAPVTPSPPAPVTPSPPAPAAKQWATAKLEMTSGRPKTILAFFPGVIEWIETSGKEAKSNDVIVKLQGYKPLEAQVATLTKETEKLQAELQAAFKARDAIAASDEAATKKAQGKVDAAEKAYNTKSDQLLKKTDQLEPYYVRLVIDGTLTVSRKVGEKIPENTPIATIVMPPTPSATFKLPPDVKVEFGMTTAVKLGERFLTCEVADWEPEKLRIACEPGPGVDEGATVSWQLP